MIQVAVEGAALLIGASDEEAAEVFRFLRPAPAPVTPNDFAQDMRDALKAVRARSEES